MDMEEKVLELEEKINALEKKYQELLELMYEKLYLQAEKEQAKEPVNRDGKNNPRYIAALKTSELIADYVKNNYHITRKMRAYYKETYNISYNGMRNRLIKEGIWREKTVEGEQEHE